MFWRFENGTLLNLNALEDIGFYHDAETEMSHVRGRRRDGSKPDGDLFSSRDVHLVKMVVEGIAEALEVSGLVIGVDMLKIDAPAGG